MTWPVVVILLLVLAMMVGPIMMLKPSRRQQQLAHLRQEAAQLGLRIELQSLAGRELAVYELRWPSEAEYKFSGEGWALDKLVYDHGIHFDGRWQWRDARQAPEAIHGLLREGLQRLPAGVQAVEATHLGLRCAWVENGGSRELGLVAQWLRDYSQRFWPFMRRRRV